VGRKIRKPGTEPKIRPRGSKSKSGKNISSGLTARGDENQGERWGVGEEGHTNRARRRKKGKNQSERREKKYSNTAGGLQRRVTKGRGKAGRGKIPRTCHNKPDRQNYPSPNRTEKKQIKRAKSQKE